MIATATGKELMDLEEAYWTAIKDKDSGEASRLSDESCLVVGASGAMTVAPSDLETMIKDAGWDLKNFKIDWDTAQFNKLTDDVTLVAYEVTENLMVEGKPVSLKAYDASVWKRKNGSWTCVMHTESLAGDAFGRDKK